MRSILGTAAALIVLGAMSGASAQTFLSPGALAEGTQGYFGPGQPMTVAMEGRSASTGTGLWCDSSTVLCYPATFRTVADMTAR